MTAQQRTPDELPEELERVLRDREEKRAEFVSAASAEEVLHVVDELLTVHEAMDEAVELVRAWIDRPTRAGGGGQQ